MERCSEALCPTVTLPKLSDAGAIEIYGPEPVAALAWTPS